MLNPHLATFSCIKPHVAACSQYEPLGFLMTFRCDLSDTSIWFGVQSWTKLQQTYRNHVIHEAIFQDACAVLKFGRLPRCQEAVQKL